MSFINEYFYYLIDVVLVNGFGWALFLAALIYMLWWLKRDRNRNKFVDAVEWVFLEVKVDELNEKSALAMEQIFAALHAIHQNFTWGEQLNGKVVLFLSCEIISLGGKVAYIFKIPARYRSLFESAVFAQYSKAEVTEVEDYLKNLPHHFDPKHADFDFWGTEWLKKKENAYPIRTYFQTDSFEHSALETFVDPLSNVIEAMSNMQPYELMVYQLVIKPVDDKWKDHTKHLVDKLKGVPTKHGDSILWKALFFVPDLIADFLVTGMLGVEKGEQAGAARIQEEPPSLMLHRTDVEKMVITAIEHAMSKVSYEIRLRTFYLAPKDKFNSGRKAEIVGAFRNFDEVNINGLKPDIKHSWTDKAYKLSEALERPYTQFNILMRKRHMLHRLIARSHWKGVGKVILNTEELATIFHFPIVPLTRVSQIERVQTVKSAPPMDLPIK